ncbi:MAG: hypothetical protein HY403_09140 [Elusimicrobia bacterium]|nr:hypothetical protein [Elusimicrobiota bacterium]
MRNRAEIGGRGARARPDPSAISAPPSSAALARRLGQAASAPKTDSQAAISAPVQGRGSTAAHGTAAARTQTRSNSQSPAPTSLPAAGAAAGKP